MIYNKVSLRIVWPANTFNLGLSILRVSGTPCPCHFDLFSEKFFKIKMSENFGILRIGQIFDLKV